jgi:hypothetical protein
MNTSGMFFTYSAGSGTAYGNGDISSFMFDFWVTAMGEAKDLHVLTGSDETSLDTMIAWMGKATVGMLGGDGDGYCFTEGDSYTVRISSKNDTDPRVWYDNWADIYTATAAAAGGGWPSASSCGNTLLGSGSGIPDRSPPAFWDQKVAAAAYMARYGVTGASAAWSRLTGASNWADVQADCDVYPLFCLEP